MLRALRRDVPGFVWAIGVVGLLALAAGYRLELESKAGDGLRELGWLGVGVLVTVAGVDIAQRRARAGQWQPVTDELRLEARQMMGELTGQMWSELGAIQDGNRLVTNSIMAAATLPLEPELRAAEQWFMDHWARLHDARLVLSRPVVDASDEEWRAVSAAGVLVSTPGAESVATIEDTTARLLAVLDRLVEIAGDPTLASEHNAARRQLDGLVRWWPRTTGDFVFLDITLPLHERLAVAERLDALTSVLLTAALVVGRLVALERLLRD